MAGLVTASRVDPTCGSIILRKSGRPDFLCHPRPALLDVVKLWMPATSAGMTCPTEASHGECKTQGEGNRGQGEKAPDEGRRQISEVSETRAPCIGAPRAQAATVCIQPPP